MRQKERAVSFRQRPNLGGSSGSGPALLSSRGFPRSIRIHSTVDFLPSPLDDLPLQKTDQSAL